MPAERKLLLAGLTLALGACRETPTFTNTSGKTDSQLNAISANLSELDGQGDDRALMSTPTVGQQMDADRGQPRRP